MPARATIVTVPRGQTAALPLATLSRRTRGEWKTEGN